MKSHNIYSLFSSDLAKYIDLSETMGWEELRLQTYFPLWVRWVSRAVWPTYRCSFGTNRIARVTCTVQISENKAIKHITEVLLALWALCCIDTFNISIEIRTKLGGSRKSLFELGKDHHQQTLFLVEFADIVVGVYSKRKNDWGKLLYFSGCLFCVFFVF